MNRKAIREARFVYFWVTYNKKDGVYIAVQKKSAEFLAEELGDGDIDAKLGDDKSLFVG